MSNIPPLAPSQIRHLDLSRKTDLSGNGTVVVKLTLSNAEAGALKIKGAEEKRIQVEIDPVTGIVTLTGSAAAIHAALAAVVLEVRPGFAKTFNLIMDISQEGEAQQEKLILYFERASGLHVPMDGTGSGGFGQPWDDENAGGRSLRAIEAHALEGAGKGNTKTMSQPGEGEDGAETVTLTLPPVELRPGYDGPQGGVPSFGNPPSSAPGGTPVSGGDPVIPGDDAGTDVPPVTPPPDLGGTGILHGGGGPPPMSVSFALTAGVDNLQGTTGNDTFTGDALHLAMTDSVFGAGGADILRITASALTGTTGAGVMTNVTGVETFQLNSDAAHSLTFTDAYFSSIDGNTVTASTTATTQNVSIDGSAALAGHHFSLSGGDGADTLRGGAGDDTLSGGAGGNRYYLGAGNDSVAGGAAQEGFYINGGDLTAGDTIRGNGAQDELYITGGISNLDTAALPDFQGIGRFFYNVDAAHRLIFHDGYWDYPGDGLVNNGVYIRPVWMGTVGIFVDASTVTTGARNLDVRGNDGADTIIGSNLGGGQGDYIMADAGNDSLVGLDGDDRFIFAGSNLNVNDTVLGGAGSADEMWITDNVSTISTAALPSLQGVEIFRYQFDAAHVLTLDDGYYSRAGFAGSTVTVEPIVALTTGININSDAVLGGHNISITGGTGADTFTAGAGADTFTGGNGADVVRYSNAANLTVADSLVAGAGQDVLSFNTNSAAINTAVLTGVSGFDDFYFNDVAHSITLDDTYYARGGLNISQVNLYNNTANQGLTVTANGLTTPNAVYFWTDSTGNENVRTGGGVDTFDFNDGARFTTNDTISGGGDQDALRIVNGGAAAINTATFTGLAGVENFQFNSNAAHSITIADAYFGTAGFSGSTAAVSTTSTTGISVNAGAVLAGHNISVTGGSGGDTVTMGGGADNVSGGTGQDTFYVAMANLTAADTISGGVSAHDDELHLTAGAVSINTGTMTNLIGIERFEVDADVASTFVFDAGYNGRQALNGTRTRVYNNATTQGATVDGSAAAGYALTFVTKTSGNDSFQSAAAQDFVYFDPTSVFDANDTIQGGAGMDTFTTLSNGGSVINTAAFANFGGFETIRLNDNEAHSLTVGDAYFGTAGFSGTTLTVSTDNAATAITVNASAVLAGHTVSVTGGGGADTISDGAGDDTVSGGNGNNRFVIGTGTDSIVGGTGDDDFRVSGGLTLADTLTGGTGTDSLTATAGALTMDTNTFTSVTGIETIALNSNAAHSITIRDAYYSTAGFTGALVTVTTTSTVGVNVTGSSMATVANQLSLTGFTGNDTLIGGSGSDTLSGDDGNDYLRPRGGVNLVMAGNGDDTLEFRGGSLNNDTVQGGAGLDTVLMNSTPTSYNSATFTNFHGVETFLLNDEEAHVVTFTDAYYASAGFQGSTITVTTDNAATGINVNATAVLAGHFMNATGGGGADTLRGGAGADTLSGGNGADSIVGGTGADSITGGAGADTMAYLAASDSTAAVRDQVSGFVTGTDKLSVSVLGAINYIGNAAFSGVAGQVRWQVAGADVVAEMDTNGDSAADLSVLLLGIGALAAGDFI